MIKKYKGNIEDIKQRIRVSHMKKEYEKRQFLYKQRRDAVKIIEK